MSNSYTKAAFALAVTGAEAEMLRRVIDAADLIGDPSISIDELETRYADLGPSFAALFPRTADNPFSGLLDLFPDVNFPYLDFDTDFRDADGGQVVVTFSGEQFGIEVAANLIQRCAPSALPFGFEWASDCDRLRTGEFGGGYVAITGAGIEYGHTSQHLDRAIARAGDEGADGFVLAIRDPDHGLSFWGEPSGFGRLLEAKVFSEAEAAKHIITPEQDEATWIAMPRPLRL